MSSPPDERLERWLAAVLATPGLTGLRDLAEARRRLVEDSLRGVPALARFGGPVVDVGSGGGVPGIPLAAALPVREVTLLEATRRKADFLERWVSDFPNLRVVWGRAEEQPADSFGVALAKALAPPAVALEWSLPLVRPGGAAVIWVGPAVSGAELAGPAERLGGGEPELENGLFIVPKLTATPAGFPRRVGVARKHPLT